MDNISEIKSRLNIIDLIGGYVQIKKSGKNYKGLCPFHSEKTPSFMVSEELQRYRCFGCGKSGDMFNFVMDFEGVDFSEALKLLADKAHVELKFDKQKDDKGLKQKIIAMNQLSCEFYHHLLLKHPYGEKARKYLEDRKIKPDTIKEFKMGYAPNSWDSISHFLIQKGFTSKEISDAGLGRFRKNNKDTYDMFRSRLMFPLIDHLDRIVGFAGRALDKDQDPKYINTQETEIFHKERFLFGLNLSKAEIRKKQEAIIVEGEFDMITPYQEGYKNIVASKGTALTLGQVALVKRYAETIILIFDNDSAGLEAAIRGVKVIQNSEVNIKVAQIPEGSKDPDDLVLKDPKKFKELIKNAMPLWDYYFLYVNKKYNLSNVFERKKASDFLLKAISSIEDDVIKAEYIKKFGTLFDVDESTAISQMAKTKPELNSASASRDENQTDSVNTNSGLHGYPSGEIYLLALLAKVDNPKLSIYVADIKEEFFSNADTRSLFALLKQQVENKKGFDIKAFHDKLQADHESLLSLFEQIYLLDHKDNLLIDSEVASTINRLKRSYLTNTLKELSKALKKAEAASDLEQVKKLQNKVKLVSQNITDLSL